MFIELAQCDSRQSHKGAELLRFHVGNFISCFLFFFFRIFLSFMYLHPWRNSLPVSKNISNLIVSNRSGSTTYRSHSIENKRSQLATNKHWSTECWPLSNIHSMSHNVQQSRHLCSHRTAAAVLTSGPGHSGWPAGSAERLGLMSASTWEGLRSQQGETSASLSRVFPCFYDAENIVLPLSCWYTVAPGYHYCTSDYIFSCLDRVFFLIVYCLW